MTDASVERIITDAAPKPAGHYSQDDAFGDLVFVSGQLPVSLEGKAIADMSFEDQVRQALANLLSIVKAAGSGPDGVRKVTAFIVGVVNWPAFNAVYGEVFGGPDHACPAVTRPGRHPGRLPALAAVAPTR